MVVDVHHVETCLSPQQSNIVLHVANCANDTWYLKKLSDKNIVQAVSLLYDSNIDRWSLAFE